MMLPFKVSETSCLLRKRVFLRLLAWGLMLLSLGSRAVQASEQEGSKPGPNLLSPQQRDEIGADPFVMASNQQKRGSASKRAPALITAGGIFLGAGALHLAGGIATVFTIHGHLTGVVSAPLLALGGLQVLLGIPLLASGLYLRAHAPPPISRSTALRLQLTPYATANEGGLFVVGRF